MKDSKSFEEKIMQDEADLEKLKWAAPYLEKVGTWFAKVCDRGLYMEEARADELLQKDRFMREQLQAAREREDKLLELLERLATK